VIPKHLLVNQILEKSQLLVHRLIVVPMKVAMTMKIMNKNNLQIYTYFFLSCSKKYINPAQIFFFSINTSKNKSRELCLLCCFSSCCSYYSYFLMLLYISSCVPVSWSYRCVLFFCSVCDYFAKNHSLKNIENKQNYNRIYRIKISEQFDEI
jgi:hypothetical protein